MSCRKTKGVYYYHSVSSQFDLFIISAGLLPFRLDQSEITNLSSSLTSLMQHRLWSTGWQFRGNPGLQVICLLCPGLSSVCCFPDSMWSYATAYPNNNRCFQLPHTEKARVACRTTWSRDDFHAVTDEQQGLHFECFRCFVGSRRVAWWGAWRKPHKEKTTIVFPI